MSRAAPLTSCSRVNESMVEWTGGKSEHTSDYSQQTNGLSEQRSG